MSSKIEKIAKARQIRKQKEHKDAINNTNKYKHLKKKVEDHIKNEDWGKAIKVLMEVVFKDKE